MVVTQSMEQHCSILVKQISRMDLVYAAPVDVEETGARERTRRAILDAAVATFAKSPNASLTEVAERARVGRTTLHRYFPERSDLITAVGRLTEQAVADASKRARLTDGTGLDAVLRLCQEYFELSDVLTVMFFTSGVYDETTSCLSDDDAIAAVERGRDDSSIDAALDASWILNMMWALLYAAVDHANRGSASRIHAQTQALTSLRKAIGSPA
ncbi:TetR/AcrR family transcriptional regulator [Nocardia salmonicida]|uniref:TetR/AcrR family transcriptional regulator n=1 Tax=Nocardia salmonicida TaxID=53431 RepID=UPI0033EE67CC